MKIVTTFNNYFAEIVYTFLNLFKWPGNVTSLANDFDIIDCIVLKFDNHSSIKMVKKEFRRSVIFIEKP